jgi:hypothetical protein
MTCLLDLLGSESRKSSYEELLMPVADLGYRIEEYVNEI